MLRLPCLPSRIIRLIALIIKPFFGKGVANGRLRVKKLWIFLSYSCPFCSSKQPCLRIVQKYGGARRTARLFTVYHYIIVQKSGSARLSAGLFIVTQYIIRLKIRQCQIFARFLEQTTAFSKAIAVFNAVLSCVFGCTGDLGCLYDP